MPDRSAITLEIAPALFVAGDPVEGEVVLDFPLVQEEEIEEIVVKLRGSIRTQTRLGESYLIETTKVVHENKSLWSRGHVYPPPDTHVLRLPFKFELPARGPSSFDFTGFGKSASVRYMIQVIGVRGIFHLDRIIKRPLAVVQPDPRGAELRLELHAGWRGEWGRRNQEEKIRKGIWGDYSTVKAELWIPHMDTLPLFVPIPFTVKVTSITAPTKLKDTHPEEPIFPTIPQTASEIELELRRTISLTARNVSSDAEEIVAELLTSVPNHAAVVEMAEKIWIPKGDDGKGTWVQETKFHSTMTLRCPPTFKLETLCVNYYLHLKVPFPGIGNSLRANLPITISSGVASMVDRALHPDTPPTLDLPPAYWDVAGWDLDDHQDHKD
ncbi:hypothetical protein A0H81_14404 [Grifola frondosa]|uniref:Arrestin-like N-terminal domain-containing protein n=1 Tax=Grifola frondosa TaxID=5627 RepID=A0A1C7LS58_GRIFR|nr:hypothetical protein A0H81_14404 [Grifola frondosa]